LNDGVALLFDSTAATRAALFLALSKVLPMSQLLNAHQKRSEFEV
jgi:hypothetical protein